MSTVTTSGNELSLKISKPYRGYQSVQNTGKFCMQIESLKLNFYHQAADSVGLHGITWKK